MKLVDINKRMPEKPERTKQEIAQECLDAIYANDNNKEFFMLSVDKEGIMGVYSSMDYPTAYMCLDGAKMVLMEYYTDGDE